mgnify:FL=1
MINIIEEGEENEIYVNEIYHCYCMECIKIKNRKDSTWSKYKAKYKAK